MIIGVVNAVAAIVAIVAAVYLSGAYAASSVAALAGVYLGVMLVFLIESYKNKE